jgi:hypothetical protein
MREFARNDFGDKSPQYLACVRKFETEMESIHRAEQQRAAMECDQAVRIVPLPVAFHRPPYIIPRESTESCLRFTVTQLAFGEVLVSTDIEVQFGNDLVGE